MNPNRWQYETVTIKQGAFSFAINVEDLKKQLNEMGQKGWELVSTTQLSSGYGLVLVFKRPV